MSKNKSNLEARIRNYDKMVAGSSVRGVKFAGVNPLAFHKPGSNKK